jgi:hypothetical protein
MPDTIGAFTEIALVETFYDPSSQSTKVRNSFLVTPSFGAVWYRTVDLGFPSVRESVQDLPQSDGTYDETQYYGSRAVSIEGVVINNAFGDDPTTGGWDTSIKWNSAAWFCALLSGYASPSRRFRLYFTDDSERSRFMEVRGSSFTAPVGTANREYRDFQLQFTAPSGKILTFAGDDDTVASGQTTIDGRNRIVLTQSLPTSGGRTYPTVGPYRRTYGASQGGDNSAVYLGTVPNGFIANIYTGSSPMIGPRLSVLGPDNVRLSVGLSGVTIPFQSVITIDTIERTVTTRTVGSTILVPLDQYLVAPLQWPLLKPGNNRLIDPTIWKHPTLATTSGYNQFDFDVSTAATDAYVEILYYDADLL